MDKEKRRYTPLLNGIPYDPGPPPELSLGRHLTSVEHARIWLTHPANWHDTELFVVKWNGHYVTVNHKRGQELIDRPHDIGLLEVVVWQQKQIKQGRKADPEQQLPQEG